jgi:hypothetical protein
MGLLGRSVGSYRDGLSGTASAECTRRQALARGSCSKIILLIAPYLGPGSQLQLLQRRTYLRGRPALWTSSSTSAGLEKYRALGTPTITIRRAMKATALNALGVDA